MRFWAFISYSWADRARAVALHRRLERFVIPRHVRGQTDPEGPTGRRLRPVFRDDDEMAASGPLDQRLRTAIDDSPAMVLLASPDSAESHYVDLEVAHFLETHDLGRLVIVAIGENTIKAPELPPALKTVAEPLWVDLRGGRRLDRRGLVRIAAAVLGVDFDALWRRHVRRLRQVAVLWCALVVVLSLVVGTALLRQQAAEQRSPEQQRARFLAWMQDRVLEVDRNVGGTGEVKLNIVRVDDLDNDGLMDFFVVNESSGFCGSGGCAFEVYRTRSPGEYERVIELLGSSTPRVRAAPDGTREIITSDMFVSREPLYSVHSLQDGKFKLKHYEFCDGIVFEMCEPLTITPVPWEGAPSVAEGTIARERPSADARAVIVGAKDGKPDDGKHMLGVRGIVAGGEWYLAELWKGFCGFVPASTIRPPR